MVAIPLPYGSAPGFRAQEGAGRLVNAYAEPLGEGRQDAKRVRVPGMTSFFTAGQVGFRGMFLESNSNVLYVAFKDELYKGAGGGALVRHMPTPGQFPGTKTVYFARNNASPTPHLIAVTELGAFQITQTPDILPYAVPAQPNSVFGLDGYLVFTIGDGRAYATDLNSLTLNSLSFANAEAKPDGLVRGIAFSGRALFFGTQTLEIWIDVGTQPFPFQ